jgi:hypothetical protein
MSESHTPWDTSVSTRWNPPGQKELTYRAGTYSTVLQRLLAALADQNTHQGISVPPLNTDPQDNWAVGLFQAWAIVIDVLTFYQERIANEGYFSTATERRSILELARLTGYQLRPGIAASTYLAFTVGPTKNGTSLRCLIPKGIAVQSVPTQTQPVLSFPNVGRSPRPPQLPVTFETSEQFEAHSEWNALLPAKSSSVAGRTFRPGTMVLRLDGIKTGLKAGDVVLLVGSDPSYTERDRPWIFASLTTVVADPKQWYTQIAWEHEVRHSNDPTPIKNPLVFVFQQQAKLFGYTRSGIAYSPVEKADWSPSGIGLPNAAVYKLLLQPNGSLFAATDNGVFRSTNDGETWDAVNSGLMRAKVQSLTSTDDGTLYAGTGSGNIFVSSDNGNNWRLLLSRPRRTISLLALLPLPRPKESSLPKSVIHDLATFTAGKKQHLVAATDQGVFQSTNGGQNWQSPHTDVSAQEIKKRGSAWSFATLKGKLPFVGMDTGVYPVEVKQRVDWRLASSVVGIVSAIIALVLFTLGVFDDKLGAPFPQVFATPPTLCTLQGCVGSIPAYMVGLSGVLLLAVFLLLAFFIEGRRPLLQAYSRRFSWLNQHWHGLRDAALTSVVVALLLYLPAVLTHNPQLSDSYFGLLFLQYGVLFHVFLRFLLLGYALVAVVVASFLRILMLRKQPVSGLSMTVRALTFLRNGILLAGTGQGIYRSRDGGQNWEWIPQSPARSLFTIPVDGNLRVTDLDSSHISDALSNAYASNGLELVADAALAVITRGQRWKLTSPNAPSLYVLYLDQGHIQVSCVSDIRAFETSSSSFLFAGTQDGSVFRAQGDGDTWIEFDDNLHLAQVQTFVAGARGFFVAGIPDSSETESQWSRFQLQERRIDLDKLYPALLAGGWIVLRQNANLAAYKVSSIHSSVRKDFKKGRDFSSITVEGEDSLALFDRNATTLSIQSEQVALFDDQPVQGDTIPFSTFVPGLYQGQKLFVSGKRLRLRLTGQIATSPVLVSTDGLRQVPFTADDTLIVLGITVSSSSENFTWQLEDRNGFIGSFTAPVEVISYEPATDQDQVVSELTSILAVQTNTTGGQATSTVKLEAPLHNVYDRASTSICANVVRATHGQTIENEVLGGVDMGRDQQRFMLRQKPLTYTSAIEAEEHLPDTLQVLVNGMPWHMVSSLYDVGSNQRAYRVQQDSQDVTWLTFGDGEHGAHLPSGKEHITTTYRIGSGKAGNVAAQSLTILRKRAPGIQKVTNPIPASGGADAESLTMARVNAPLHVQQTMPRIVSFNDFTHFVQSSAGIGKVLAQSFWSGRQRRVLLTIASEDGQQIDKESVFYQNLRQAITGATSWPARLIEIEPCEIVYFQLEASLVLAPDSDENIVKASVTQKLSQAFRFERRELARSIAASEVVALMQSMQEVVGVKLKSLSIKGEQVALNSLLEVKFGRDEDGVLRPAQLLLIDADNQGIRLSVE